MFMYHYMHNFLDLVGLIHVKKITIKNQNSTVLPNINMALTYK